MLIDESLPPGRTDRNYLILCGAVSAIAAALIVYSQTMAFAYDEGFHLLTAQLIKAGKRPYIDFFFPQTPLNAYWNATLMKLFGESWRAPHVSAALMTSAAAMLTADFVYFRCPAPRWRLAAALTAAFLVGSNAISVEYGTIGQGYGICTFLGVAAFRCVVSGIGSRNVVWAMLAGFLSALAAGCSLLSAPFAPVLAAWILFANRAGSRWIKLAAFAAGAAISLSPILWLYSQAPREVWFNLIDYHLRYRELEWSGAWAQNLQVLTSWLWSPQALIAGILGACGLWFVRFRSGWERAPRTEFYVCGWLTLALVVHISRATPTFERYYILCVPFLAMLGALGLYSVATRLSRTRSLAAFLIALMILGMVRRLYDARDDASWKTYEEIAQKVKEVTPPGGAVAAEEIIHFLSQFPPKPGMEHSDARKLDKKIPADLEARIHVMPQAEVDARIKRGDFATVETCKDEEKTTKLGLPELYRQKAEFADCTVFWDMAPKANQ